MPVSMYCDRDTTDIFKSQAGFLKNVCIPLYEVLSGFLKSTQINTDCYEQIKDNLSKWEAGSRKKTVIKNRNDKEEFLTKIINRKNSDV